MQGTANERVNQPAHADAKQLNYFFDYGKWNDLMNQQKPEKARPNKNKKKKKVLKF